MQIKFNLDILARHFHFHPGHCQPYYEEACYCLLTGLILSSMIMLTFNFVSWVSVESAVDMWTGQGRHSRNTKSHFGQWLVSTEICNSLRFSSILVQAPLSSGQHFHCQFIFLPTLAHSKTRRQATNYIILVSNSFYV